MIGTTVYKRDQWNYQALLAEILILLLKRKWGKKEFKINLKNIILPSRWVQYCTLNLWMWLLYTFYMAKKSWLENFEGVYRVEYHGPHGTISLFSIIFDYLH